MTAIFTRAFGCSLGTAEKWGDVRNAVAFIASPSHPPFDTIFTLLKLSYSTGVTVLSRDRMMRLPSNCNSSKCTVLIISDVIAQAYLSNWAVLTLR